MTEFITLHDKSPGETRVTSDIYLHNKYDVKQANSHHQLKQRENESISTKIRNKTGCSFSPCLSNIVLEILSRVIQTGKKE